jgi:intein-encoded DNA endonuclease-like protein
MSSIFDKTDNQAIINRINALTLGSKAQWGKMTVDQMCKHCSLAIAVAFGEQDLRINFLMKLLGKMLKKKVIHGNYLKRESPTAKEFIVTKHYDLEKVKSELITHFSRFATEGESAIQVKKHPFWGTMTNEEWDLLMWKHLDHHLKQFGV